MEGKPVFVQGNVHCGCSILAGGCKICSLTDACLFCSCVGVEEDKAAEIDLYHCPNCEVTHGPSVSESTFFVSLSRCYWIMFISKCTYYFQCFFFNKCANAVEATSSQIMEPLEREFQLDLLKREARSLSGSYGAVLSQSKSLLKPRLCKNTVV